MLKTLVVIFSVSLSLASPSYAIGVNTSSLVSSAQRLVRRSAVPVTQRLLRPESLRSFSSQIPPLSRQILASLSPPQAFCTPTHEEASEAHIEDVKRKIARNSFTTDRNLVEYTFTFPTEFSTKLGELGPEGHWLDIGSGESKAIEDSLEDMTDPDRLANYIQEAGYKYSVSSDHAQKVLSNLAKIVSKTDEEKPSVTGITYVMFRKPTYAGTKLSILKGRYFEDISTESIEKADLISDFYGAYSYSPHIDVTLQKTMDLLKDDGAAYIWIGGLVNRPMSEDSVKIKTSNGTLISGIEWLQQNPTLRATLLQYNAVSNSHYYVLKLTRRPGFVPQIPRLTLYSASKDTPPERIFTEKPVSP